MRETAAEALQLLYLHQKEARLLCEPDWVKRRRGESWDAHGVRLGAMAQAQREREREQWAVAEAARREAAERGQDDPPPNDLPDLAQVTGWSKASGQPRHEAGPWDNGEVGTCVHLERVHVWLLPSGSVPTGAPLRLRACGLRWCELVSIRPACCRPISSARA